MKNKTRAITFSAMFSSLAFVFLYLASAWPTGQLGTTAVSSLFIAAAVIEIGLGGALAAYIVASALALLLLPFPLISPPILFAFFFGGYPILKSVIERAKKRLVQWPLKFLAMNASLTALYFLVSAIIGRHQDLGLKDDELPAWAGLSPIVLYAACNVAFGFYDYGLSKLIWFYQSRVSKHLR